AGNLYGTTIWGGVSNCSLVGCGTVFRLSKNGSNWVYTQLHVFNDLVNANGVWPGARPIVGPDGSLYGTTEYGGRTGGPCYIQDSPIQGCGTVYRLTPPTNGAQTGPWVETVVYRFRGAGGGVNGDGLFPLGDLVFDATGSIYGTTPI